LTAREATKAALARNGLDMMAMKEDDDDGDEDHPWGRHVVEAIRLYGDDTTGGPSNNAVHDSMEDAAKQWIPGQNFDFVIRNVPARKRLKEDEEELFAIDQLVEALDPDGTLREENAKELDRRRGDKASAEAVPAAAVATTSNVEEALLSILDDDDDVTSLAQLANDAVRRTENSPREVTMEETAFGGSNSRGYQVVKRSDLKRDSIDQDGAENEKSKSTHAIVLHCPCSQNKSARKHRSSTFLVLTYLFWLHPQL
jgi:hypothetical protein